MPRLQPLTPNSLRALLLFDIDGVIRDVSNSYRRALAQTVARFSGWTPDPPVIDALKAEGRWNNDWEASLELLRRRRQQQPSLCMPSRHELVDVFSGFYFGRDATGNVCDCPDQWNGTICNEPLLVQRQLFEDLSRAGVGWGFVSGAEPPSARYVLEHRLGLVNPPLMAMGDAPDKPDPTGFLALAERLATAAGVPPAQLPIGYLGDTVADVLTVVRAREQQPELALTALAVTPPHVGAIGAKGWEVYRQQLLHAGADHLVMATADLTPTHALQLLGVTVTTPPG